MGREGLRREEWRSLAKVCARSNQGPLCQYPEVGTEGVRVSSTTEETPDRVHTRVSGNVRSGSRGVSASHGERVEPFTFGFNNRTALETSIVGSKRWAIRNALAMRST